MGVGDVLDQTFRLYRRDWVTFLTAMAIVVMPAALLSLLLSRALGLSPAPGRSPTLEAQFGFLGYAVLKGLVAGTASLAGGLVVVRLSADAVLARPLDVAAAYRIVLERFWASTWTATLSTTAVCLLAFTVVGLPFAVYLTVGWLVSLQTVLLEGRGARESLRRSAALITGHRWRVLSVALLATSMAYILASLPAFGIGLAMPLLHAVPIPGTPASMLFDVIATLAGAFGESLFVPLIWIAQTVLYYELRVRKEAIDLEQRTEAAEPARPLAA